MDKYSYVGWIPCVNRHLDFGLMKVGIRGGFTDKNYNDNKIIEKNYSASGVQASHDRIVVLQSKVDWRDRDSDIEDDDTGRFRLFVCAKVAQSRDMDQRVLEGDVLIYPLAAEPESIEGRKKQNVHQVSHAIDENNIKEKFFELSRLLSDVNKVSGLKEDTLRCSLHFIVEPNGIVKIRYNDVTCELNEESHYIVARQVFYYLKYAIHSHRHHVDEQDSLTTITQIDQHSGLRLVCQLKRELTTLSREQKIDNRLHATNNAEGIIAYSKSLLLGLMDGSWISPSIYNKEISSLENVSDSFASLERKIERSSDVLEANKAKSKVLLGFLLIGFWGFFNFIFESEAKLKVNASNSFVAPVSFFVFAIVGYMAFKKYYKITSDPSWLVRIYNIDSVSVLIKVGVSLAFIITLTVFLFLDKIPAYFSGFVRTVYELFV